MKHSFYAMDGFFRANTAQPALPGFWYCPLQGKAAMGCIGGEK